MQRIGAHGTARRWTGYALAVAGGLAIVSWAIGWVEAPVAIVMGGALAALAGLGFVCLRWRGDENQGWVGRRVVVGVNDLVRVRVFGHVVTEDPGWPLYIWNVERVDGRWVQIRFEDSEMVGWVEARQVAPLDEAVEHYTRLLADSPSAWAYRRRAAIRNERGDLEGAIQDYSEAIRLEPSDPIAYSGRAKARHARREFALAIADYDRLIQLAPSEAEWYQGRGNARFMLDEKTRAIEDFSEAIRLDSSSVWTFIRRGDVYLVQDDLDRALADYDEAVRLDREDPNAHASRGIVLALKLEHARAAAALTLAIRHDPRPGPAHALRGLSWHQLGEYNAAVADFTDSISLSPDLTCTRLNRAYSLYNLGRYEEALADYEVAVRLDPADAEAHWGRGLTRMMKGEYEEGLADFDEAIRIDPAARIGHQCRAWLLATCPEERFRNGREAIASATRACELDGWESAEDVAALAAAFAEAGEFDRAVETQRKVIDLDQTPEERAKAEERLAIYAGNQPYRM